MPKRIVELPTGTLYLHCDDLAKLEALCGFGARANPKRGFLIVSKVLGRHLPVRPKDFRRACEDLAAMIPGDTLGPVVFLGMAETATALGQATWAAWREINPGVSSIYLQTSRQRADGSEVISQFEEGHSHATSHMIQIAQPSIRERLNCSRRLVIIDDECSTGGTFLNAGRAMAGVMPALEMIECASLTDWSGGDFLAGMPSSASARALLYGSMEWVPAIGQFEAVLSSTANRLGTVPSTAMRSRIGLAVPETVLHSSITCMPGQRVLILGDGEHSYAAVTIAEEVERAGGVAAIQSITRTPALIGHSIQSVTLLEDSYGSGAMCHLYNLLAHRPQHIIVCAEVEGRQVQDLKRWLNNHGSKANVELAMCRYDDTQ